MSNRINVQNRKEEDIRIQAVRLMWGWSAILFITCIPITAITWLGILLPLVILVSLAIGTTAICFFHGQLVVAENLELKQLQERIINLETIASHGELGSQFDALAQQVALNYDQ